MQSIGYITSEEAKELFAKDRLEQTRKMESLADRLALEIE